MSTFAAAEASAGADAGGSAGARPKRRRTPPEVIARRAILTVAMSGIVIAFLSPLGLQRPALAQVGGADRAAQLAPPAVRSAHVRLRGRDGQRLLRAHARRHDPRARAHQEGPPGLGLHRSGQPWRRADHLAGVLPVALAALAGQSAVGQLRRGLERPRLPAPAVQHGGAGVDRDDRHRARVHPRRVRVRAVPVPRARRAVHAAAGDDLPARWR